MHNDNDRIFPTMAHNATVPDSVALVALRLSNAGIRRRFFDAFFGLEEMRPILHGNTQFLQIGISRRTPVAVDCDTLGVWQLLSCPFSVFVNSSYDLFDLSMEMISKLDLSTAEGDDVETLTAQGDTIRDILLAIDPHSMAQDSFWDTFVWDVRSGDFSDWDGE